LTALQIAGLHPGVACYGVEQNSHLAAIVRENHDLCQIAGFQGSFEFELCDLSDLPVADHSVDAVFCSLLAHRVEAMAPIIKEMERVKTRDGVGIVFDLARDADMDAVAFISEYVDVGSFQYLNVEQFVDVLSRSYSLPEMRQMLSDQGMGHWGVNRDGINLIAASTTG
jgi:ubiquinone/menaquinone biosynthesis C-methylase UbiE